MAEYRERGGGSYRIVDAATKAVINDYVLAMPVATATHFVEVPQNLAAGVRLSNYISV